MQLSGDDAGLHHRLKVHAGRVRSIAHLDYRIIGAVRMAPLAEGVIGQTLDHHTGLVGEGCDRAQMILVEVARVGGLVAEVGALADRLAATRPMTSPPTFMLPQIRSTTDAARVTLFRPSTLPRPIAWVPMGHKAALWLSCSALISLLGDDQGL